MRAAGQHESALLNRRHAMHARVPPSLTGVFSSRQGGIVRHLEPALVPLSLAVFLLFVVVGIDRSVWLDEANSIVISSHSFAGIAERLRNDNNLPAYYYLLAIWPYPSEAQKVGQVDAERRL
jgi:hypothetical protein